jgi:hypothetical protein
MLEVEVVMEAVVMEAEGRLAVQLRFQEHHRHELLTHTLVHP